MDGRGMGRSALTPPGPPRAATAPRDPGGPPRQAGSARAWQSAPAMATTAPLATAAESLANRSLGQLLLGNGDAAGGSEPKQRAGVGPPIPPSRAAFPVPPLSGMKSMRTENSQAQPRTCQKLAPLSSLGLPRAKARSSCERAGRIPFSLTPRLPMPPRLSPPRSYLRAQARGRKPLGQPELTGARSLRVSCRRGQPGPRLPSNATSKMATTTNRPPSPPRAPPTLPSAPLT